MKRTLRTDGGNFWNNTQQWVVSGIGTTAVSGRRILGWNGEKPVLAAKVQSFPNDRFTREDLELIRSTFAGSR